MNTVTYRGLWRWHFHAGLLCIPFVLVLAITGSIYLFKPQIDAFADRGVDSLALTGPRATGEQHVSAALASLPGSKLFVYEVPLEPDDAVRVHLYSPDGTGRIVYVHPHSLEILKSVPHTARLTEIVRTIHANLMAGRTGALLLELAACWAIVMLGTGLFLWWPRDARGAAGVIYPRVTLGRRVFWRDLHAVTGIWVAVFAMFLLITALPWTTVAGEGIGKIRGWVAAAPKDWSQELRKEQDEQDEHGAHRAAAGAAGGAVPADATSTATAAPLGIDQIIARIAPLRLEPPVRLYLPKDGQPFWRVRAETQNRPKVRDLELDAHSGALLSEQPFADKTALDKAIHIGIAAHEGQLFGLANQLLGLFTALGLVTICVSAVVMWLRRKPDGALGVPAPRIAEFRIGPALKAGIVTVGLLLPVLGMSVLLLWIFQRGTRLPAGLR